MNRILVRIDLQELLLRMLAPALRRHGGDRPLDELQQRLLHALAGHVAGDRGVVGLARDLVDLVDIDDARLGLLDVVVALLQQLLDDVLDVLADIARLGQRRGIGDGERHVQQPRQRLGEKRLAAAGRPDQQDVALGDLDVLLAGVGRPVLETLVVVVDGDRQHLLGALLADDVLVEDCLDLVGLGKLGAALLRPVLELLADDVVAQLDALVADEHRGAGNQLADLMLALAAERAVEQLAVVVSSAGLVRHIALCCSAGDSGPALHSGLETRIYHAGRSPRKAPASRFSTTTLSRCGACARFRHCAAGQHGIDQPVLARLLPAHEVVPVGVPLDAVERLAACA